MYCLVLTTFCGSLPKSGFKGSPLCFLYFKFPDIFNFVFQRLSIFYFLEDTKNNRGSGS